MTEEIIKKLEQPSVLTFEESFNYAQFCSSLLNDENFEKEGRKIIINILNNWYKIHTSTIELWTDLIEAAGFYPYLDKYKSQLHFSNLPAQIRKEMHVSEFMPKYYHDEQYKLSKILNSGKNLIVSAPTSFGKSLLIEEVISSMKFKNIVIIQPTLALLDETRKKLIKYTDSYKLIVRTSQDYSTERGNIFLFTAERVNEYGTFPNIDFLVIDEFYKLSGKRDDERSSSLNNAFHFLLKTFNPKFYLLGPNIDGISDGFEKEYDAVFYKSQYSLVDSREVNIFKDHEGRFGASNEKKKHKEKVLFELLSNINEQSIIYCSSPNRVRQLSKRFTEYLIEINSVPPNNDFTLIEWIKENISKDWGVIKNLIYGIGIHDGALQKHITSSIIDYFNSGKSTICFVHQLSLKVLTLVQKTLYTLMSLKV
jgi:replicative superfamily II helicase